MSKKSASFVVLNDKGLHTRPSTELVKLATRFRSKIRLLHSTSVVNAKSLLGILMLAAEKGTEIEIEVEGPDADEALAALLKLASNRFHMNY